MSRVLIFGKTGQLARCLAENPPGSVEATFLSREQADFSGALDFKALLAEHQPDLLLIAAAYTAVDQAEQDKELAHTVNAGAVGELAAAARAAAVPIVHVSTDYVFPGDMPSGAYTEEDQTGPAGVYGETKLAGERLLLKNHDQAYIFRTAWVYSAYGKNFLKTMLTLAETHEELGVVNDQVGTPTSAHDLASALWSVVEKLLTPGNGVPPGVYHMVAGGHGTWYDFAARIFEEADAMGWKTPGVLNALKSEDFPTPAKRPSNSRLSTRKLKKNFDITMPDWRSGIAPVLRRLK